MSYNGVKIFSATMFRDRQELGDRVSEWISRHPERIIDNIETLQSSDKAFHCLTIVIFYTQNP